MIVMYNYVSERNCDRPPVGGVPPEVKLSPHKVVQRKVCNPKIQVDKEVWSV